MKSFSTFIIENTSDAPYGVIFDGDDKVYIGSPHGKLINLSEKLKEKVLSIVKEHGVWYEGNGGDIKPNIKLFGDKKSYEGSWDDEFAKTVKGYPIEFIGLFGNVKENKLVQAYTDPDISIFDSIIKNQKGHKYFEDRSFGDKELTEYLIACSEKNIDLLEMSKEKATKENVNKFLTTGEKLAFPSNWYEYPNNAGKLVKKIEDRRNNYLLSRKSGAYVVGAGHLIELKRLKKTLKMIGGEKAAE